MALVRLDLKSATLRCADSQAFDAEESLEDALDSIDFAIESCFWMEERFVLAESSAAFTAASGAGAEAAAVDLTVPARDCRQK